MNAYKRIERCEFHVMLIAVVMLAFVTGIKSVDAQEAQETMAPVTELFNSNNSESYSKLIEWLSNGSLDPNMVLNETGDGTAIVHYAAANLPGILRAVIANGGRCNLKNTHGAAPLHFAAAQESLGPGPESIRMLVECGADIDLQDNRGATPLHAVYRSARSNGIFFKNLEPAKTDTDKDCFPCNGGMRQDILQALLEFDANPNIRDNGGDTPLMLVIKTKGAIFTRLGHMRLLLEYGAGPDAPDNKGATPLIQAILSHSGYADYGVPEEIINTLLEFRADPDLRDGEGDTALIHAAKDDENTLAEIEALLAGGADPCLADRNGKLPYDHASEGSSVRNVLYKAGGYFDKELGMCARDAHAAMEREKELNISRDNRRRIQSCLKSQGFDPGTPDGLFGPRTRKALQGWQIAQGFKDDESVGYLTSDQADTLLEACKVALEPNCAGKPEGAKCWKELANRPGCYIWDGHYIPTQTAAWSGSCSADGVAVGKGTADWKASDRSISETGLLVDGKFHGHLVVNFFPSREVWEGPFVNGKLHGYWVKRGSQGEVWNCWQNGERVDKAACNVATVDSRMEAKKRTAFRSGPGNEYESLGLVHADAKVQATSEVGDWLWVENSDGQAGYVHTSALEEYVSRYSPGDVFRDCSGCPEMVVVPAGKFNMGANVSEKYSQDSERPVHQVTISEPFAVGKYEVTFSEWDACVAAGGCGGYRPDDVGWGRGNRPVIYVSWEDANRFARWLSSETGKQYRLLSESEWEYAARAGTTGPFHFGSTISTDQANYNGNYTYGNVREGVYRERTVPVGSFPSNKFGLHDMHGNVHEWVEDCWHSDYRGAPTDGSTWTSGGDCDSRGLRGGSWGSLPGNLRAANRNWNVTGVRDNYGGLRVARTLTP